MTDALPLPGYDKLPLGALESRIRSLDAEQLERLIAHEEAHGHRLPVLEILRIRLEAVRDGAPLTGGSPDAVRPEAAPPPEGAGPASPDTTGPPVNPPPHGDPTNPPGQPRR